MRANKVFFITATDTGAGKTVTTFCLGVLLKNLGRNVGVMKPVQCAGQDAQFLKRALGLKDESSLINPFYAPEPLSPHLAFRRAKISFDRRRVQGCLKELCARHEIVLVEGAGGLLAPITDACYNADLVADLKAELIIVARTGLGTINHTLLTISEAKKRRLKIKGIIFCQTGPAKGSLPEKTNPKEIERLSGIKVIGTIPYMKPLTQKSILQQCQNLKLNI